MINQAKINNIKLGVISQRRFFPVSIRLKKAIDSGKLVNPILANLTIYDWRIEAYYSRNEWQGTWKDERGGILLTNQLNCLIYFFMVYG